MSFRPTKRPPYSPALYEYLPPQDRAGPSLDFLSKSDYILLRRRIRREQWFEWADAHQMCKEARDETV